MRRVLEALHTAFHQPETPLGRTVESVTWALILGSIGLLIAEPLIAEDRAAVEWLRLADRTVLFVFGIELFLRVLSYRPPELLVFRRPPLGLVAAHLLARLRYLFQPMTLIDLITVAALIPALRGLRVFRLLRLLRRVRVFRYGNPFGRLAHALERDRLLFLLALGMLGAQVVLGGLSFYLIERKPNLEIQSPTDGLWAALVTITTVGYGDITPETGLGRVLAAALMVGGMFTLATFAGIVGHSLLTAVLSIREDGFRMSNYVNHLVVCGYEDGMHLLLEALLHEHDPKETRIVVFANMERPADVPPEFYWVRGDPTKESELDKVRLAHAAAVVVAGRRQVTPQQADAETLLALFTIRSYLKKKRAAARRHKPLYVAAEILDSENVEHARTAGADEVIETRRLGFGLLSHAIEHHGTADTLSKVVLRGSSNLYVGLQPEGTTAKTFGELVESLQLQARGGMVIGIVKRGEEEVNPGSDTPVDDKTCLLYLAPERLLEMPV